MKFLPLLGMAAEGVRVAARTVERRSGEAVGEAIGASITIYEARQRRARRAG